ncbi:unnamed protein product [Triticum turgidum subsp. durum]|uniref:BHLH domain-containing protein n=1 Tax=Triticum turgidum subsp. durum TaxID=4567 RepID=A0A9R0ZCV1_TRITD|nr:unnamed protein product [Triticum turgidum subsp. durum]
MKDANAKKRKAPAGKGKAKEPSLSTSCQVGEQKEADGKRCRTGDAEKKVKPKAEQAGSDSSVEDGEQRKGGKGKNAKPAEPPKDYVHVRARRGQATDSHSLAERVRRERISQRMKFLQDLVPGCNKVIGKALMLDEIINYVQSLQRQVEFLSMKLATVNPLDFSNLPTLLHKDMYGPSASSVFSLESSSSAFPFSDQGDVFQSFLPSSMESQCTLNQLDLALSQATNAAAQYAFQDGTATASTNLQQRNFWEDDLQSVFHVDTNRQSQDNGVSAESFHAASAGHKDAARAPSPVDGRTSPCPQTFGSGGRTNPCLHAAMRPCLGCGRGSPTTPSPGAATGGRKKANPGRGAPRGHTKPLALLSVPLLRSSTASSRRRLAKRCQCSTTITTTPSCWL